GIVGSDGEIIDLSIFKPGKGRGQIISDVNRGGTFGGILAEKGGGSRARLVIDLIPDDIALGILIPSQYYIFSKRLRYKDYTKKNETGVNSKLFHFFPLLKKQIFHLFLL